MTELRYERPGNLDTVRSLLAENGSSAKVAAGGQSLMLMLRQGLLDLSVLVDISAVSELTGIELDDGTVRIGAATTYADLGSHAITSRVGGLADAVEVIADPQVRNMGTIGGAVCHADPSLDVLPVLLCLEADALIGSTSGTRRLPLDEFSNGYMMTDLGEDELLETIVYEQREAWGSSYVKLAAVAGGWATVGAAAAVRLSPGDETIESARVALSAVDDTPVRAPSVEAALRGAVLDPADVAGAARVVGEDIDPIDDLSGSAGYKTAMAETLTERAVIAAAERAKGGP